MLETLDTGRLFLALAVGLGLIVAGIGNVLLGSRRAGGSLPFAALGVAVAVGIAWLFESPRTPQLAGLGAAACGLLALGELGWVRRKLRSGFALFRSPRARWALVAVAGIAGLGYELTRFEQADAAAIDATMDDLLRLTDISPTVPVPGVLLQTDSGTAVTPVTAETQHSPESLRQLETTNLANVAKQVISRGPPSSESNCHGWVFTGGRYGIRGRDVPTILAENGYTRVETPAPGDACVYRSVNGEVCHTALVRAVCDDGTVLVEGKWGWLGVYLHPVAASCYGIDFQYYHTARKSHLLAASVSPPSSGSKAAP